MTKRLYRTRFIMFASFAYSALFSGCRTSCVFINFPTIKRMRVIHFELFVSRIITFRTGFIRSPTVLDTGGLLSLVCHHIVTRCRNDLLLQNHNTTNRAVLPFCQAIILTRGLYSLIGHNCVTYCLLGAFFNLAAVSAISPHFTLFRTSGRHNGFPLIPRVRTVAVCVPCTRRQACDTQQHCNCKRSQNQNSLF